MPVVVNGRVLETEAEFSSAVRDAAAVTGCLAYHTFNSQHSAAGFPDWTILTPSGLLLFAELKREDRSPTATQTEWLERLGRVERIHAGWYRPSEFGQIARLLGAKEGW